MIRKQKAKKQTQQIVTVVESPVDRIQVPLEDILQRTDVIIEFPNENPIEARKYVERNNEREVYVVQEGSEDLLHGKLVFYLGDKEYYGIDLARTIPRCDCYKYSDLRKMIVMK